MARKWCTSLAKLEQMNFFCPKFIIGKHGIFNKMLFSRTLGEFFRNILDIMFHVLGYHLNQEKWDCLSSPKFMTSKYSA